MIEWCCKFQVSVGQYVSIALPTPVRYIFAADTSAPLEIIIVPIVIVSLLLGILLVFTVVWCYHRKVRVLKAELGWMNMINQIELSKLQPHES